MTLPVNRSRLHDMAIASQVAHLKRGVYGWDMEGLPFEGEYDPKGAGRTPSVVEEEIFAYGRKVSRIFV